MNTLRIRVKLPRDEQAEHLRQKLYLIERQRPLVTQDVDPGLPVAGTVCAPMRVVVAV